MQSPARGIDWDGGFQGAASTWAKFYTAVGVYGFGLIGARFYTTVGRVRAPEKINKQNREARFYTTRWGVYGLQRSTWARSTQPLGVYGLQESIRARFYTAIWRVRAPGKKCISKIGNKLVHRCGQSPKSKNKNRKKIQTKRKTNKKKTDQQETRFPWVILGCFGARVWQGNTQRKEIIDGGKVTIFESGKGTSTFFCAVSG